MGFSVYEFCKLGNVSVATQASKNSTTKPMSNDQVIEGVKQINSPLAEETAGA
jgi:hypothetical protein